MTTEPNYTDAQIELDAKYLDYLAVRNDDPECNLIAARVRSLLLAILDANQNYVCVPVEPTEAMLEHARIALVAANFLVQGEQPRTPEVQERILISAAYKAMLAASKETNRE